MDIDNPFSLTERDWEELQRPIDQQDRTCRRDFAQRPRAPQFLPPSVQPNPPYRSGCFPVPKIQKDNA